MDNEQIFDYTLRQTRIIDYNAMLDLVTNAKTKLKSLDPSGNNDLINDQIKKLDSLKPISIPMQDGSEKIYYSIADSAGGVTEKTCLIDEDTLRSNLEELIQASSVQDVKNNKVQMNAFLKHPKAGVDTEVQREAMGLQIARMLGFPQVTKSTLVLHDTGSGQHPCLFVPFGTMVKLTDSLDHHESFHGRIKSIPQSDNIEDFGKYSAFFMLCSDPDFIGKQGQNKGLATDAQGNRQLYIFDQVFMSNNNFAFDRGLNLIPVSPLSTLPKLIALHFMGRNKSVINDSSYEEKIGGIIQLLSEKESIRVMFDDAAKANNNANNNVDTSIVRQLQSDAKICLKRFNQRMAGLYKFFPVINVDSKLVSIDQLLKSKDNDNKVNLLKKSMLLNSLLNKPKLFDKYGKPYRAPYFSQTRTHVRSVSFNKDSVTIGLGRRFGRPLSERKKAMLEAKGFYISPDGKTASISNNKLLKLDEKSFFEIQQPTINMEHDYINRQEIQTLAKSYGANNKITNEIINLVCDGTSHTDLGQIEKKIEKLTKMSGEKNSSLGFIQHVKQCMIHEGVRQLMSQNAKRKDKIQLEFTSSLKSGTQDNFIKTCKASLSQPNPEPTSQVTQKDLLPENILQAIDLWKNIILQKYSDKSKDIINSSGIPA